MLARSQAPFTWRLLVKTDKQKLTKQKLRTLSLVKHQQNNYSKEFEDFASKLILRGANSNKVKLLWLAKSYSSKVGQ